jgi:hypothetical protein
LNQTGEQSHTLQNYTLNWSPFPGGALQFRFSFNENRRPEDGTIDRIVSPGVRYMINNRSYLDVSYQSIRSAAPGQSMDSNIFSANLRVFL